MACRPFSTYNTHIWKIGLSGSISHSCLKGGRVMGLKFKYSSVGQSAVGVRIPRFPHTVSEIFPETQRVYQMGNREDFAHRQLVLRLFPHRMASKTTISLSFYDMFKGKAARDFCISFFIDLRFLGPRFRFRHLEL